MHAIISLSLAGYFLFYALEGPVRYGLYQIGADEWIFIRDLLLAMPLIILFIKQLAKRQTHPAYWVFAFVMALHGCVSLLTIGSWFTLAYSAKLLMGVLAGAVFAPYLLQPGKRALRLLMALWCVTLVAVLIDKYWFEYPWTGIETTIGNLQVDVTRDWEITGADKRAGGLMRSSINVAIVAPLLALVLMFHVQSRMQRIAIALATLMLVFWTTQKGAILGLAFTCGLLAIGGKRPLPALTIGLCIALLLAVCLPLILPQYHMPHGSGVFSLQSFVMRIEDVWPEAWRWIGQHEAFPFGVGLGGIGGAQRLYNDGMFNFADNLFIFLYAYFGVLSFVYLGWLVINALKLGRSASSTAALAVSILVFLGFYGCVLSIVEDQMAALFIGAAAGWVGHEARKRKAAYAT